MDAQDVPVLDRISRSAGGFSVTSKTFRPEIRVTEHCFDGALLCVVLGGWIAESDRSAVRRFRTNDIFYRPPGERHSNCVGASGARVLTIELDRWRHDLLDTLSLDAHRARRRRSSIGSAMAAKLCLELAAPGPETPLVLEALALQLTAHVLGVDPRKRTPRVPAWLARARMRIEADPTRRYSVDALAIEAGASPSRLSRWFRSAYGCSVREYQGRLRIERAISLLTNDAMPLAEIAVRCGFYDQSHFTRVFHTTMGLTPHAFRRAGSRSPR